MSTVAGGADRLSGLSDDLLRRVLHFVPAQEGAITSALSRRWRPLWRSCGAVNLEGRVDRKAGETNGRFYARRDGFVSAAHNVLDAADGEVPVRKLTIRVEASRGEKIREFLNKDNVFDVALSHPAARCVEELRIAAVDAVDGRPMFFEKSKCEADSYVSEIYPLGLGSLPSETLRVLELTNCSSLKPAAGASFPQLLSLQLRHCNVSLEGLQDIVDAAPLLAVVHLDSVPFEDENRCLPRRRSLRCPAATAMVLDRCFLHEEATVEISAPMLRRFRYRGVLRHISLIPPPPHLARAELTLVEYGSVRDRDPHVARQSFWGTIHGFSHAKEMKLRVRTHLEELATTNQARQAKLLSTLRNLERLELQGVYTPTATGKEAAAAIGNLLRCCPALCDLRINLSTSHEDTNKKYDYGLEFLERKYRSQLEDSIHRFKRRRPPQPAVAGDEHDDANYDEVPDVPGLSGHSFECLRRCLRRVGLQFRRQRTDCLGIKLIKFFAENAKVLEEMCVDAGNDRIGEHMNLKIEKWIGNKSMRRRIDSTSATKVRVLPLTRSN